MPKSMKIPSKFEGQDEVPLASDISWILGMLGGRLGRHRAKIEKNSKSTKTKETDQTQKPMAKDPKPTEHADIYFLCVGVFTKY